MSETSTVAAPPPAAAAAAAAEQHVTPTIRQAVRRWKFWLVVALLALAVVIVSMILTGAGRAQGPPLSPTSAGPTGSKAIAEVLRAHGVEVNVADSFVAVEAATSARSGRTLFVVDDRGILDRNQLLDLLRRADRVVIMTPNFDQLDAVAPDVALAGTVDKPLTADCDLPSVRNAGSVSGAGSGYRLITHPPGAVRCLGSGDGVFSLIQLEHGSTTLSIVGTRDAFSNEHVAESGNAAFALNLLGQSGHLVWYLPSIGDAVVAGSPTLGDLTPEWVSAVAALLFLVAIAAAFWRGRRLGPLVIENLPVTVRASETMEGRARLYQKSAARLRALDALRVGTISRLGTLCGLPSRASVDDVIVAVAALTGRKLPDVSALLRDADPASDAELVRTSDALLDLEREASATQPGRNQ